MKKITFLKTMLLVLCIIGNVNAQVVTTFAGSGTAASTDNTTGSWASFFSPTGMCTDGSGNLYVTDLSGRKIRKIVIATGAVTTVAGSGSAGSADNTNPLLATFDRPYDICYDGVGSLYVADAANNKIRKIVIATRAVSTFAGSGNPSSIDGIGLGATFNFPTSICFDNGSLYVADYANNKIRKVVITTAVVSTLVGSGAASSIDGTGTAATFNAPAGICTDGNGNLYTTEELGHIVRKTVIATRAVTTVAGTGSAGFADGTSTNAVFNKVTDICFDGNGRLLVIDQNNNRIRQIVLATGVVTTFAGSGNLASTDGTGINASFDRPWGITYFNSNVYVSEIRGNKIRKVTAPNLNISTLDKDNSITVYPNPSTGIYNIDITGDATIEIFDVVGKQLQCKKITNGANQLDLTQYNSGVYLAKVTNDLNQSITIKIVKE